MDSWKKFLKENKLAVVSNPSSEQADTYNSKWGSLIDLNDLEQHFKQCQIETKNKLKKINLKRKTAYAHKLAGLWDTKIRLLEKLKLYNQLIKGLQ